jgi:hypothetical protein
MGSDLIASAVSTDLATAPLLVTSTGYQEVPTASTDSNTDSITDSDWLSAVDAAPMVPQGLQHRIMAVEPWQALASLVRLLRSHIQEWEAAGGSRSGKPRPRAVIFAATDAKAREAAPALQNALWGQHKLYALLPEEGKMPLQVLEFFAGAVSASKESDSKRKQSKVLDELLQKTTGSDGGEGAAGGDDDDFDIWGAATAPTVLLTTPSAARGLDFANLTHVYSLNVPLDVAEYAHQA